MDEKLPITVTSKGLFEKGDKSSEFLMTKLEAWLNFKTLQADWYCNENEVISIIMTIMPEKVFLNNEVDRNLKWQTYTDKATTALFHHNKTTTTFKCFIMLSNDELNEAMSQPTKVESMLQSKLSNIINHFGNFHNLKAI